MNALFLANSSDRDIVRYAAYCGEQFNAGSPLSQVSPGRPAGTA
jgi:hypothetical protein